MWGFVCLIAIVVLIWTIIHIKICVKYNQKSIFDNPSKEEDDDNIITNRTFNLYENNNRLISHV